jgi:hypothetical protein
MGLAATDTREAANDERTVTSARPGIAARAASAARGFILLLSRLVRGVTWLVVAIIVAGILLRVLGANGTNAIVHDIHTTAKTLIGPFSNVFKLHSHTTTLAVNWGLAAIVYLILGTIIAGLIAKTAPKAR